MGADLYIRSIADKDKGGDAGYFRDSYNGTNLFWVLGLSWWHDVNLDDEGNMPGEEIKRLRQEVATRAADVSEARLRQLHCKIDDGENSVESWRKFFEEKRGRLLAFFDEAIALGEPIDASL